MTIKDLNPTADASITNVTSPKGPTIPPSWKAPWH